METLRNLERVIVGSRRNYLLAVGLGLVVLAATIMAGWLYLRTQVRQQIAHRDAEALYATTLMEQLDARSGLGEVFQETDEQIGFDAAILASRLKGVLGIRFFNTDGQFTDAFPATIQPGTLPERALTAAREMRARAVFRPAAALDDIFIYLPQFATGQVARVPTLEVTVPLHRRDAQELAGIAQFVVAGQKISEEYARLDRWLGLLAGLSFMVAGVFLAGMLWPAFRRMERLAAELVQRNIDLQRANQELTLAARASALGAVSAHLMHGLKNPLASISQFMNQHRAGGDLTEEDWQDVLAASRRMQALVQHTVEVIADAQGQPAYEMNTAELCVALQERWAPIARQQEVCLVVEETAGKTCSSHVANLISLVLFNLGENAIQATPRNKQVTVSIKAEDEKLVCHVRDEGPGFPAPLRDQLFLPCKSTRPGGSGIGLAICKQIADRLGAVLELADTPAGGCLFVLEVPLAALRNGLSTSAGWSRPAELHEERAGAPTGLGRSISGRCE